MKHEKEYTLTCFDVDFNDNLRPTSFMEYAQDMAEIATDKSGYGYTQLKNYDCAWVVIRMHTVFEKTAHLGDTITMSTWHRGVKGPFFVRDYQMKDSKGNSIARSTSSWVVMDCETRSLSRNPILDELIPICGDMQINALDNTCPKITMPKEGVKHIGSHKVVWSDVDHNHHANNVKYIVWAIDALNSEIVYNHSLKECFVNFNKEVAPNSLVELYYFNQANEHIIEGIVGETQVFICKLIF